MSFSSSPNRATRLLAALKKRQGGFTIFHALVAGILASVVMTGTWMAYRDFTMQARVSNADRQMDQYAAATMQELTNMISWSWGGQQVAGGLYPVWKFQMKDIEQEFGRFTKYQAIQDLANFVTVSFGPTSGILIGRRQPDWAVDSYVWRGRLQRNAPIGYAAAFDRRDGMTMTGMQISFPLVSDPVHEFLYQHSFVDITIHMQYRYSSSYATTLYPRAYIHERTFSTRIFMRNWDVETNDYRADQERLSNTNGGA